MTNNFSFKNNYAHNIQDVHIKKEDLLKDIDQQLQSIFTSIINDIDQDKNGIINTKELKAYYENTIESNTQNNQEKNKVLKLLWEKIQNYTKNTSSAPEQYSKTNSQVEQKSSTSQNNNQVANRKKLKT